MYDQRDKHSYRVQCIQYIVTACTRVHTSILMAEYRYCNIMIVYNRRVTILYYA